MYGPEFIMHNFMLKILKMQMLILCYPFVPKGSQPRSMILYDGDKKGSGHPRCRQSQFSECWVSTQPPRQQTTTAYLTTSN